ncbi:MAG: Bug family tripartite tricarboxylate transporter substrate binding protein [Bacillota bacterium]
MSGTLPFVVPFGRDGAADRAARVVAARLGCEVENVPGDGGLAGVRRANALASTRQPVLLLATPTTHVLLPSRLGASAAPDPAFKAVLGLGSAPNVLLVSSKVPARTVDELVALAQRETLTYASAGVGQTIHACSALFCALAGVEMTHRPYDQGSAAAYADLARGDVHVYFDNALACTDAIVAGHVVPLAVSSRERHPGLRGVPTLRECGCDHALDVWMAVFAANLGRHDAERVEELARSNDLERELGRLGLAGGPQTGAEARVEVERSSVLWRSALEALGR